MNFYKLILVTSPEVSGRTAWYRIWWFALLVGLLGAASVHAQGGGSYELKSCAFTSGAGVTTNAAYRMHVALRPPIPSMTSPGGFTLEATFPGIRLIQQPGAPRLTIARAGLGFVLAWPRTATGYKLQSTASLETPDWIDVPEPVHLGEEHTVILPPAKPGTMSFFRLLKP